MDHTVRLGKLNPPKAVRLVTAVLVAPLAVGLVGGSPAAGVPTTATARAASESAAQANPDVSGLRVVPGDRQVLMTVDDPWNYLEYGAVIHQRQVGAQEWEPSRYLPDYEAMHLVITELANGTPFEFRVAWGRPGSHGGWSYSEPVTPQAGSLPDLGGNTRDRATPIHVPGMVQDHIHEPADVDWWKFAMPDDVGGLRLSLEHTHDLSLTVMDASGREWSAGTGGRIDLPADGLAGATVYVRVSGVDGEYSTRSRYELSIDEHPMAIPGMDGFTASPGDGLVTLAASDAFERFHRYGGVLQFRLAGSTGWEYITDYVLGYDALTVAGLTNGTGYYFRAAWGTPDRHGAWGYSPMVTPRADTAQDPDATPPADPPAPTPPTTPPAPPAVEPAVPPAPTPTTPAPRPRLKVHVKAVGKRDKLAVRVSAVAGGSHRWRFSVWQRKAGQWRPVQVDGRRVLATRPNGTRVLNLGKGTYRVKVEPGSGRRGATSKPQRLVR